ncbi:MAG: hypothetical protein HY558_06680 [Euryarchaeota archaeon]|nr:hypothetical protein [Euryarchaeota archaeon]
MRRNPLPRAAALLPAFLLSLPPALAQKGIDDAKKEIAKGVADIIKKQASDTARSAVDDFADSMSFGNPMVGLLVVLGIALLLATLALLYLKGAKKARQARATPAPAAAAPATPTPTPTPVVASPATPKATAPLPAVPAAKPAPAAPSSSKPAAPPARPPLAADGNRENMLLRLESVLLETHQKYIRGEINEDIYREINRKHEEIIRKIRMLHGKDIPSKSGPSPKMPLGSRPTT